MIYVIDLATWGITQGIPAKPYLTSDYYVADANIQGFNNAIQWAYSEGYREVIVPKGEYAICYPRKIVVDKDFLTLNLNGATFKVIYDSTVQSPFDTRTGVTDYYNFPSSNNKGVSFQIENANNSHIKNGIIIGERKDRSFVAPFERTIEWTYGINIAKGAKNCTVDSCQISFYMGDSISFESSSVGEYAEFSVDPTLNDLDKFTGQLIPSTNSLVTKMIPFPSMPANTIYNSVQIMGFGFSRPTSILTKDVGIYFYKEDGTFLVSLHNRKIYSHMTIPEGAKKYRIVFYNETNTAKVGSTHWGIHMKFGLIPHKNVIKNNEIFGNHRGGITPGGNYNVIQDNLIHDIGNIHQTIGGVATDFYGLPIFNDPTRYGINQEDSYGDGTIIKNNIINGCFTGILCGSYYALIEGNHIYNCGGHGINLYTMVKGIVKDNILWKCVTNVGIMNSHFANAHVEISGNTFVGGNSGWNNPVDNVTYHVVMEGNTFIDPANVFTLDLDANVFRNNHFKINTYHSAAINITISDIEDCTFEVAAGVSPKLIVLKTKRVKGCTFINSDLRITGRNQSTLREKVKFDNCTFIKSIVNNEIGGGKRVEVDVTNGRFVDSIVKMTNVNQVNENNITNIKDSDIVINTNTFLLDVWNNKTDGYSTTNFERCSIEIANPSFLYLIKNNHAVVYRTCKASFKDCNIKYTGSGMLALVLYSVKNCMREFISARNIFSNITLPARDAGIFVGYDPLKQDIQEPSSGVFFVGDERKNASLSSGSVKSWICISSPGVHDDLPRIANNTPHAVSAAYVVGDQINVGGQVYECTVAGTTGIVAPTWNTTSGATTVDGTITWKEVGHKAVFVADGLIP